MKKHIDYILKGTLIAMLLGCLAFIVCLLTVFLEAVLNPILPIMYIPSIAILGLYIAGFIYSRITEEHGDD
jgi:ABC-type proline/glycine betaine transport system permease subunit